MNNFFDRLGDDYYSWLLEEARQLSQTDMGHHLDRVLQEADEPDEAPSTPRLEGGGGQAHSYRVP
jgi:hypothetical protein